MDRVDFYDLINNILSGLSLDTDSLKTELAELLYATFDFSMLLISLRENTLEGGDDFLLTDDDILIKLYINQQYNGKKMRLSMRQRILFSFIYKKTKEILPKVQELLQKHHVNLFLQESQSIEYSYLFIKEVGKSIREILLYPDDYRIRNIVDALYFEEYFVYTPVFFDKKNDSFYCSKPNPLICSVDEEGAWGLLLPIEGRYVFFALDTKSPTTEGLYQSIKDKYHLALENIDQYLTYKASRYESVFISFAEDIRNEHASLLYVNNKIFHTMLAGDALIEETKAAEKLVAERINRYKVQFVEIYLKYNNNPEGSEERSLARIQIINFLQESVRWDGIEDILATADASFIKLFALPLICEDKHVYTWQDPFWKKIYNSPTYFDFVNEVLLRMYLQGTFIGIPDLRNFNNKQVKKIASLLLARAYWRDLLDSISDSALRERCIDMLSRFCLNEEKIAPQVLINRVRIAAEDMQLDAKEKEVLLSLQEYTIGIINVQYKRFKQVWTYNSIYLQKYNTDNYFIEQLAQVPGVTYGNRALANFIYSKKQSQWVEKQVQEKIKSYIMQKVKNGSR